jgi:hypothetical protein
LTTEIKEVERLIDAMNEVSSQLKKSEGNKAQEFVNIKSSEKETTKAKVVENEHQKKTEETVCFIADQNIKAFLQQMHAFGKVACNKTPITGHIDRLYKVRNRREINVQLSSDTSECDIEGSCLTGDGFLLMTDRNNNKLKRLDMSTETVKDYLDLQASPRAVCLVSKTEASVALYDTKTIQFVSLENKLTATRSLTMNHKCWGLVHKDGKLIISDGGNNVYIHDMNGRELQRISTDAAGKDIFQRTRQITISDSGDKVFVADHNKGVVILDNQGRYLSTLTDRLLPDSCGLCTDGRNLFVSNYFPGSIVQIGQDYKVLGKLEKVDFSQSLCFDRDKTRLYVTRQNSIIIVLEIE